MQELLEKSAVEQSRLVASGEVSALLLTELYLARIRRHNPLLNAVVSEFGWRARKTALLLDRERAAGRAQRAGPLFGVPSLVKDTDFTRFSFTRFGSRSLRYVWSVVDGPAARAMRRAGMVILGKSAPSELGILPVTETALHGATRNPWDPSRSPGGSSGGAGAAVAARMIPVAHGSDGAGSIRIPAALSGLFGYKASRGYLVHPYGAQDVYELATIGPLGRAVEDLAALGDIWRVPNAPPLLARLGHSVATAKIWVVRDSALGSIPAAFQAAVHRVARGLRELGHQAVDVPVLQGGVADFLPIYQRQFSKTPVLFPRKLGAVSRWLIAAGKRRGEAEVRRLAAELRGRARDYWGDADFCLTPAVGMRAPRVGCLEGLPAAEQFHRVAPLGAFTAIFNLTGQPAVVLPTGCDEDGLPVGVQLVGRPNQDAALLALAARLAQHLDLRAAPPPLARATDG